MNVVGLDIGSTAVRGVQLSGTGKNRLSLIRFHEVALPPGAVSQGEVIDSEVVESALKKLWSEGRFKSKNVVLGTGNQRVLVRDLSVPKMSISRIRETLPSHVLNTLQMPLDDSLLDFYPISESMGDHASTVNGLLIVAEKSAILGNIRVVERAGLTPLQVDLIPFALNRLLISRPAIKGVVALIDVGGNTTSILIAKDGVPLFVRIIPAGGDDLTQALKSGFEIDIRAAEDLKRTLRVCSDIAKGEDSGSVAPPCSCPRCLTELAKVDDPRAAEILQRVMGELLGSLRNTINYFNNTRPEDPIRLILLTGGGTRLPGFKEALKAMTDISVVDADPFATITLGRKINAKRIEEKRTSISVALGLALWNLP